MDSSNPHSFNHRTELLFTGRTYHFVDQLPLNYEAKRHPTLLCVHGFPDFWYGWRHQIGPWVRLGFRVVVTDMLGYGGTSKPEDPAEYTTKKLSADLAALLDVLGIQRAVVIGHDWGSYLAGRFALWYPERLLGLVMMSVAYTPPSKVYVPLTDVVKLAPNYGYQLYFKDLKSSKQIPAHIDRFIDLIFGKPNKSLNFTPKGAMERILTDTQPLEVDTILDAETKAIYIRELGKGMHGPLNYYRTSQERHEEEKSLASPNLRSDLPYLFIWGTADPTAVPSVFSKAQKFIPKFQEIAIEGRGHWLMEEAKDEVTEIIANWVKNLTCSHPKL